MSKETLSFDDHIEMAMKKLKVLSSDIGAKVDVTLYHAAAGPAASFLMEKGAAKSSIEVTNTMIERGDFNGLVYRLFMGLCAQIYNQYMVG